MMSEITTGQIALADGRAIAFDRCGDGPAVVFVQGSFTDRANPTWAGLARALASHDVSPEALTPVLLTFFNTPASSA